MRSVGRSVGFGPEEEGTRLAGRKKRGTGGGGGGREERGKEKEEEKGEGDKRAEEGR